MHRVEGDDEPRGACNGHQAVPKGPSVRGDMRERGNVGLAGAQLVSVRHSCALSVWGGRVAAYMLSVQPSKVIAWQGEMSEIACKEMEGDYLARGDGGRWSEMREVQGRLNACCHVSPAGWRRRSRGSGRRSSCRGWC